MVQIKKTFFAKSVAYFPAFLPFSAFLHKKHWKSIFGLMFRVHSTQTLVEIYRTNSINHCWLVRYIADFLSNIEQTDRFTGPHQSNKWKTHSSLVANLKVFPIYFCFRIYHKRMGFQFKSLGIKIQKCSKILLQAQFWWKHLWKVKNLNCNIEKINLNSRKWGYVKSSRC